MIYLHGRSSNIKDIKLLGPRNSLVFHLHEQKYTDQWNNFIGEQEHFLVLNCFKMNCKKS